MRLSDERLRGQTVISADGNAIGSLVELFLLPAALVAVACAAVTSR